jgi:hypothetical protein
MKFTNLAIAMAFLALSASADVRGEDHDLKPYLHHDMRNLFSHGGMVTDTTPVDMDTERTTPVDLEQFPQWATEEGYW